MKNLVVYYSNNGSNSFLAHKIASRLDCDIEEIIPVFKAQPLLMAGINPGIKKLKSDISAYDRIILVGPIWMGKFVNPLKSFVNKYNSLINKLVFVSCCGSSFDIKDKKYGHGLVFKKVKDLLGDKCEHCEAFPVTLLMTEEDIKVPEKVMGTRLGEDNFKGEILERFDAFITKIK